MSRHLQTRLRYVPRSVKSRGRVSVGTTASESRPALSVGPSMLTAQVMSRKIREATRTGCRAAGSAIGARGGALFVLRSSFFTLHPSSLIPHPSSSTQRWAGRASYCLTVSRLQPPDCRLIRTELGSVGLLKNPAFTKCHGLNRTTPPARCATPRLTAPTFAPGRQEDAGTHFLNNPSVPISFPISSQELPPALTAVT
jgi:hypothetical protein